MNLFNQPAPHIPRVGVWADIGRYFVGEAPWPLESPPDSGACSTSSGDASLAIDSTLRASGGDIPVGGSPRTTVPSDLAALAAEVARRHREHVASYFPSHRPRGDE